MSPPDQVKFSARVVAAIKGVEKQRRRCQAIDDRILYLMSQRVTEEEKLGVLETRMRLLSDPAGRR